MREALTRRPPNWFWFSAPFSFFVGRFMKLTDLNRDGGIGANSVAGDQVAFAVATAADRVVVADHHQAPAPVAHRGVAVGADAAILQQGLTGKP